MNSISKINIMELEKRIQADMVSAMKAKETVRLAALRGIKVGEAEKGKC